MRDPSTTHGTVITHFCVARRQGVKYGVQKSLSQVSMLNQTNEVYKMSSCFFNIVILSSHLCPTYPSGLIPSG